MVCRNHRNKAECSKNWMFVDPPTQNSKNEWIFFRDATSNSLGQEIHYRRVRWNEEALYIVLAPPISINTNVKGDPDSVMPLNLDIVT